MRAGCGDKPHVRFGRGGLVLLSNQDPAFYLTSEPGKAWYRAKDGRWMRHLGSRGKVVRCVNPCRYGCQRTQKLESRMLRKRARPVRRGEGRFGLSEIPPECSGGSEAQTVPRWPPTLLQRVGSVKSNGRERVLPGSQLTRGSRAIPHSTAYGAVHCAFMTLPPYTREDGRGRGA